MLSNYCKVAATNQGQYCIFTVIKLNSFYNCMKMLDKRQKLFGFLLTISARYSRVTSCVKDPDIAVNSPFMSMWHALFKLFLPAQTPPMPIPEDNPMTVEGIELGKTPVLRKNVVGRQHAWLALGAICNQKLLPM